MRHAAHYDWPRRRIIFLGCLLLLCIVGVLTVLRIVTAQGRFREGVLVVGDPMLLVSWGADRPIVRIVKIPVHGFVEGVYGYGSYPLGALWTLESSSSRDRGLLVSSVEEAVGVWVPWFIGDRGGSLPDRGDARDALGRVFSAGSVFRLVSQGYQTNMPLGVFVSFVFRLSFLRPDDLKIFDMTQASVLTTERLADGSTRELLDPRRLDTQLGTNLEDDRIRSEALKVIVYNTTATATLGSRVGRLLSHMGAHVVAIGNDVSGSAPLGCIVRGRKKILESNTARLVTFIYGCTLEERTEVDDRADITVHMGTRYEHRFYPRQ